MVSTEDPNPAATPVDAAPARRLSPTARRRIILASAWLCAVLAVVGGSGAAGWWLATNTIVADQPNPQPSVLEVPVANVIAGESLMPDVRGLDSDSALEVLADAGVDVSRVTFETRPFAGPTGVIIHQSPVFGIVNPGAVELIASAPASVPNVLGLTADEATDLLFELGARVDQVEVYEPNATVGVVRLVEPAAGMPLSERVVITVTADPSTVEMSQLERSGSGCSNDSSMLMDGETFTDTISCSSSTTGREVTWQLSKAVDVISGTIGIPDEEDAASSARVLIVGDGVQLALFDVSYGNPHDIELVTTGILKLSITVTTLAGSTPEVGFGDLTALGATAAIAALPRR